MTTTIREFDLIDYIHAHFPAPGGVRVGIGDDCAVLEPGRFDLVTTDSLVEDVHFRRAWSTPEDIGWKAIARCLSDIAAMGGRSGPFFLNLLIGPGDDESSLHAMLAGMIDACRTLAPPGWGVSVAGGDVTSSPGPTALAIMLLGQSPRPGPVLRSGAGQGDHIFLLGPTGLAAAGLALLAGDVVGAHDRPVDRDDYPELLLAHRRPHPRLERAAILGDAGVCSAMIDISDGLAQDLGHILSRSGAAARLDAARLPRHPALERLARATGRDPLPWMLAGGDDYELVVTVPPARLEAFTGIAREQGWDVYEIGMISAPPPSPTARRLEIRGEDGAPIALDTSGFRHFETP